MFSYQLTIIQLLREKHLLWLSIVSSWPRVHWMWNINGEKRKQQNKANAAPDPTAPGAGGLRTLWGASRSAGRVARCCPRLRGREWPRCVFRAGGRSEPGGLCSPWSPEPQCWPVRGMCTDSSPWSPWFGPPASRVKRSLRSHPSITFLLGILSTQVLSSDGQRNTNETGNHKNHFQINTYTDKILYL